MKRTGKLLSVTIAVLVLVSICSIPASALVVSGWSTLVPQFIQSTGYDADNNPVTVPETLNQAVVLPGTTKEHFKDTIQLTLTTGSITRMTVSIDDVTLTSSNLTISSTRHYESTFDLYYWTCTLTMTNLSDIVDPDASSSFLKIVTHNSSNTSLTSMNGVRIYWYDGRPDAPSTPTFVYNDTNNPGKAVLTGIDNTMEYRLKSDYDTWYSITGTSMTFDLPTANTGYYVRYASPESKSKSLTLKAPPAAPSVTVNSTTEAFSDLKNTMEMKINNGNYSDVTEAIITAGASSYINEINVGDTTTLTIRVKETETNPTGLEQVITLYPRAAAPTGLSFDPVTRRVNGVSTAMQYRVQGTETWTSVPSSTSTYIDATSLVSETANIIVEVRYTPVDGVSSASNIVEVTLPQLAAGPTLTLDLAREVITGFNSSSSYEYNTTGSATSWTSITLANNEFDISSLISASANKIFYIRTAATSTVPATAATQITVSKRPTAPTTPAFVYNNADHPEKAVLTGLTSDMEYRLSTDTAWTSCTGDNIVLDIPSANATYYVRTKGVGTTTTASANKTLTLYKRASAPSVSLNITTEVVGTLTTAMEVGTDGVNFTPVTTATSAYDVSGLIDATLSGTTTFYVRTAATATAPASSAKEILLYPRLATPTGITYNSVTCVVSGVSNTMQYRVQGATSWTAISATTLNVESLLSDSTDVIIEIRYKPVSGVSSASKTVEVTLPKLAAGPTLTADLSREVITGFDSGKSYQYNLNGSATSWTAITLTNNEFDISSLISTTASRTFYIRTAATSTVPATAATQITVSMRPSAPTTPAFVYNDADHPGQAVLTGLTSNMEYRISTDATWTACTGDNIVLDIPSANVTYYVRTKGVGTTTTASANKSLILYKRAAAPSVTLNITNETIGSLTTAMEIGTDGVNFTTVTTATSAYDVSGLIDATLTGTTSFYVRTVATATAPYSSAKEILLYPRLATPTGITYNPVTCLVSGVSSLMQYRVQGAASWTAISSTTLNAESLLSNSADVVIEIRYKPVSGVSSASKTVALTLDQLPAAPTLTLNLEAETVEGCVNGEAYQYGTNGSTWTSSVAGDNSINIASAISSTKAITLYVRKAATTTEPATASITFSISKRGTAPSAPAFVYNSVNYTGRAVLGNINSTMEYKKSTDSDWTDCPNDILVFDIPSASTTYYIRYKGVSSTTPASINKSLTLATNGAAPSSAFNITTEVLSGVTTAMEMSINSGEYTAFTATTYNCEDLIDAIASGGTTVLNIRTQATSTSPASKNRVITLYARAAQPTGLSYDQTEQKITGVDSTMQYRAVGATSWSSISSSATSISVASLITSGYTQVEVRYKPVSGASSASLVVTINIS